MDVKSAQLHTLACKLTAPELQKRKATVVEHIKRLIISKKELVNGISCEFPATDDVIDVLSNFIKSERICCDFFSFLLKVEGDVAQLSITGPDGARDFITREIGL